MNVNGRVFASTFEAASKTITERTPAGRQVVRTLDAPGRLVQMQAAGLEPVSFTYDLRGRLATITQLRGTITLAYAPATGQLATIAAPDGGTLTYTYDGALVTSESWGGPLGAVAGSVSRTYDSDFRVTSESVNGANPITFAYDPDSLLTQAGVLSLTRDPQHGLVTGTTLGSLTDARTFSTFGELSGYRAALATTELLAIQYTRDSLGRITQKTETLGGVTDTFAYTYDPAGRLTDVRKNGALIAQYAYDPSCQASREKGPLGIA